jgi:protein-tyrosine phosphatase
MNKITEINNHLYMGDANNVRSETNQFKKAKIDVIINCCNEITHEFTPKEKYIVEHFLIDDDGLDNSFSDNLDIIVDSINYHITNGKNIYVHCVQGVSRSASVVIYYLMKYNNFSFDRAYVTLLFKRPCISPNINFIKELQKKDIYGSDEESDGFFKNKYSVTKT